MIDPITLGLILGGVAFLGSDIKITSEIPKSKEDQNLENEVLARLKDATKITVPPLDTWVEVPHKDERWLVAPWYIAPIGIGEAVRVARNNGLELPTPALVDSIWKAADLKLEPNTRGPNSKPPSDFTMKTMNSPETHINQLALIDAQVQRLNPNFKLLAGSHKDVVQGQTSTGNKVGIYGWHHQNGKIIQDFFTNHAHSENPADDWKDYSQGLRLVKRVA